MCICVHTCSPMSGLAARRLRAVIQGRSIQEDATTLVLPSEIIDHAHTNHAYLPKTLSRTRRGVCWGAALHLLPGVAPLLGS